MATKENRPASANVFDIDMHELEEYPEMLSIGTGLDSSNTCNEDIPPHSSLVVEGEFVRHGHSMSGLTETLLMNGRLGLTIDYPHFEDFWGPRDPFNGYSLRLMKNIHHLDLIAASLGIDIHERVHILLGREPALVPLLISIIQRVVPSLQGWDGSGSISIDSFMDPDTDLPETIRFIFHPSDDKQWDEMMKKWNEISVEVTATIPLRSMRKRFIVSFEPEF